MKFSSSILASKEDSQHSKLNGRWTKEEHERFVESIRRFGKNWKKVEEFVGTRNGAQIRSHAQKFFLRVQREEQSDESDSKSLKEKLSSKRKISDYSESATVLAHETVLVAEGDSESKKETTENSPIRTEPHNKNLERQQDSQKQSTEEDCNDSLKVLEIYYATRKFLGLPENEIDPSIIAPFSSSGRQNGYFSQCFNPCEFSSERIQSTKLSDLLVFSEKEKESHAKIAPEGTASGYESFKLASSHAGNKYMQRKLNLLRQAPMHESSGFRPKKLKASTNDESIKKNLMTPQRDYHHYQCP